MPDPSARSAAFKVHLTGADPYQWALSEDYRQTLESIRDFAAAVPLDRAEIVHSVYWESLKALPPQKLAGKTVICNLSGAWDRYERDFGDTFRAAAARVDLWVVRSSSAERQLRGMGLKVFYIPYTVDTQTFRPLPPGACARWRAKLGIPEGRYVIGNFMRDSTAGATAQPKLVKGPDIFADIVAALHEQKRPVHVLLAGPRRHWLRKTLEQRGVPYSYAGWAIRFDDMRINTLKRPRLNMLYNMLDLSLVTSRSEAGPHAILEAAAAQCPQASTKVGIAPDLLPPGNLYDSVDDAARLIERDMNDRCLRQSAAAIYDRTMARHTAGAVSALYKTLYEGASITR